MTFVGANSSKWTHVNPPRTALKTMPARKSPPGELLSLAQGAAQRTLAERGRPLFVDDILALFPVKSRWWVNHSFLPELKQKAGRTYLPILTR
jgi:hypothetical protein